MSTITLEEAERRKPGFIHGRPTGISWEMTHNGSDWIVQSRFGSVHSAVACDKDGTPLFERPVYREAPNVNAIAFGMRNGAVHVAVLHEVRPHADNPIHPEDLTPIPFGQIPMGFLEKILGKDGMLENGEAGAIREVGEETGGTAIIRVTRPNYPYHNPSPSFVATWSQLYFIEVDLDKIEALKLDHGELIYKAEYVPVTELLRRIRVGEHEGAIYRAGTSLSLLMIFFATYPEYFSF